MAQQESALKRLLVQTTHFSITGIFALISGLITFPLFTRIFSLEEYGVMNLVAATLTFSVAVGKLGVQHGVLRYHSEISAGKSRYTMVQLYSTTLFGMAASALVVMFFVTIATTAAPAHKLGGDPRFRVLFAIASLLILVQVLESALVNLLRAEQRTAVLMKFGVTKKYVSLGLMVGAVLLISRSLTAFYSAQVVAEAVALLVLARVFFGADRTRPSLKEFTRPLYVELLGFGIPMMIGYEFAGIVLAVGDRYVIEAILGEAPLGLYGAAYNLCQYVQGLVIASIGAAIMPIYMQMYDQKGPEETSEFIGTSLRTYVLFGAPVIAGLGAVGAELLPSLASESYASGSVILPWVIAGMVVEGASPMLGAGLFIHRKTRTIMAIVLSSAILNIILNVILVPHVGIMGSAIATLASYGASAVALRVAGHKLLSIELPWGTMVRAGLVSLLMYFALSRVYPGHRLITVGVRVALGAPIYILPMVLIDADGRAMVTKVLRRFRRIG